MTAFILDGATLAKTIQSEIAEETQRFIAQTSVVPCLAAVLVGEDPASEVYVRNKRRACERVGMLGQLHRLPPSVSQTELLDLIFALNNDRQVHGILVQLPLPPAVDATQVLDAVDPLKDVDAFHPVNVGCIMQGRPRFLPCTPQGVLELLDRNKIATAGRHAVILGRSDIVGKPMAAMLVQKGRDATVTVCHSRTRNLAEITRQADILIVAIGQARFLTADMVRPGAAIIDVGINRTETGLAGDVDFEPVREVAGYLTPVPGGVGPLTVAMLLRNTLSAARLQTSVAP
jgi:methylenetetrahydrofolate dehydrogenase (NADP+)/methenyltetrahydrofolate cyclohydrolase